MPYRTKVGSLTYLLVLVGCLACAGWLEFALRTRVIRRFLRLLLTLLPVIAVFVVWDLYAIAMGHWTFSPALTTGLTIGPLPLEELLFFVIIPYCSILSFEAVRAARGWPAGDEVELAGGEPATVDGHS